MTAVRFVHADLEHFPDDGKTREIIHGDLIVSPAPTPEHQRIVRNLSFALEFFLRQNPLGEVLFAPLDMIFDDDECIQPDVIFVSNARAGIVTKRGLEGAPDWVVEVISPSTRKRDLQVKRKLCQSFGVDVYWAVDAELQEVHAWDGGTYTVYREGERLSASSLPGFTVELDELFRR
ncbi:MAG: Uma2 family endonuclease [Pleurocapsa sp. SU_196_0]|nr:Uma2 family endonuclease [Pleurocapsa sp. SU_196_0]